MTCDKFRHRSEAEGRGQLKVLKASSRENKKQIARLSVYPCSDCGGWHIGHSRYRGKYYAKSGANMLPATGGTYGRAS